MNTDVTDAAAWKLWNYLKTLLTVCKHNFSGKQKSWTFIGLVEFTLLDI